VNQHAHSVDHTRNANLRDTVKELAGRAPDPDQFLELFSIVESLAHGAIYADSRAELLIDGPQAIGAMKKAVESAEEYIDIESFTFTDGEPGREFAQALAERAGNGVAVRLIFDSVGSLESGNELFEGLEEAGVEAREFNDIDPRESENLLDFNIRDHRKLLIVDGKVAFTGGVNIDSPYRQSSRSKHARNALEVGWRDTHVAIFGPAIDGFQDTFEQHWADGKGQNTNAPTRGARDREAGNDLIATLVARGEEEGKSAIFRAYFQAMARATTRIWLTQAYFVPDKPFMDELVKAAGRGVDVRIIVPGISDSFLVLHASRFLFGRLLKGGVKIFENRSTFIHAKTAVIDGIWSTVGSSNLDLRSFLHNDDVNAVIFSQAFGQEMERQFERDLEECSAIGHEEWKQRSFWERLKQRVCSWCSYWI
jgi:cardiolipin synthase